MAGNLFDLNDATVLLPDLFIVDTNILIDRFLTQISNAPQSQYAANLFQRLRTESKTGLVTPTIVNEFLHHAIGLYVKQWMVKQGARGSWTIFYKNNPTISQRFQTRLEQLVALISANNILFLTPNDISLMTQGASYTDRVIELCCFYGLDTNDAVILLEAERIGVDGIVSMDRDLRNSIADFNIYTWV
jgi:predicted nucleic acid-binding protein